MANQTNQSVFSPKDWVDICNLSPDTLERVCAHEPIPEMNGPCPFFPGKRVLDTHLALYIPPSFENHPVTLMGLRRFLSKRLDHIFVGTTQDCWYQNEIFANTPLYRAGWHLLLNEPAPDSVELTHKQQKSKLKNVDYKTPEAVVVATLLAVQKILGLPCCQNIPWGRVSEQLGDGKRIRLGHFGGLIRVSQRWAGKCYSDTGVFAQKLVNR